ncbi:MAG: hydroxyacid dehydrogenase [Clostridiales bacterium]|jgi:(S)-sulfolactate dehydrogenase|nr:hydroxyacid dehydrogenase [Clostridiales bacterium]
MNIAVLMPAGEVRDRFFPKENAERLNALGDALWNPSPHNYSPDELRAIAARADVFVSGWGSPRLTGAALPDGAPRLLAHTGGTIAPYVDAEAMARGLRVACVNDIFARSTAEGAFAYTLCALRRIAYWDREMHEGRWRGDVFDNCGLYRRKVGLVGFGAVAGHLLKMLRAFGSDVRIASGHLTEAECAELGAKKSTIAEIFSECDVISLHASLTDRTQGMVGDGLLAAIRPGALLVNTARGGLIDEDALIRHLKTGRFWAALDVFATEPLPADSPLRELGNALLTPHMGGPTNDLFAACGAAVIDEIRRFRDGEPLELEQSPKELLHMTANG